MYYIDNSGIEHESYEAACHYYGADTPAMIEAEMAAVAYEEFDGNMDKMEAQGGPIFGAFRDFADEIPF